MPISEQQATDRTGFIGASDVPAILGMDPFKTAIDVYNDKVDPEPRTPVQFESAIWYGNHLEEATLAMAYEKIGVFHENESWYMHDSPEVCQPRKEHECGFIACHLDAIFPNYTYRGKQIDHPIIVEAKTTGFAGAPAEDDWGRAGSDKVPNRVMIQCQTQMLCAPEFTGDRMAVAKLNGHNAKGLQIYFIKPSQKIQAFILSKCSEFWHEHVEKKVPPGE